MFKKVFDLFQNRNEQRIHKGLGTTDLPMKIYQGNRSVKSTDFKTIVNDIFSPKIHELGFKGKDFFFYRQSELYTEVVFFWTYKTGGAIQVDLLVKFNDIDYPAEKKIIKPKDLRPNNVEFQKRLSPNGEKDKQGQDVWFWIFEDEINNNRKIAEDIWRVFSIRGIEYFEQFKNHRNYIAQITAGNYLDFPDFLISRVFGRHEIGILYFLFEYWRQEGEPAKAMEFAEIGLAKFNTEDDKVYQNIFKNYIEKQIP